MKKELKNQIVTEKVSTQKDVLVDDKIQLKLLLIQRADDKTKLRGSDKSLDRRNEIIELLSGEFINLREQKEKINSIIAQALKEYEPRVPQEYYREIFRLWKWPIPEGKISRKPRIVGRFTNEIIYSRYTKEILPALQILNPYIKIGIRNHKHFQWLTETGRNKFDEYIQDAISVMKSVDNWYSFRVVHSEKYKVSFQLDWEKNLNNDIN